jgi:hypothetical protein
MIAVAFEQRRKLGFTRPERFAHHAMQASTFKTPAPRLLPLCQLPLQGLGQLVVAAEVPDSLPAADPKAKFEHGDVLAARLSTHESLSPQGGELVAREAECREPRGSRWHGGSIYR